ncbi:MAG: 1-deoxy-D-xylulose-5-phosphate reductoisomerase [Chlorobi bacterium]|nr:1-deoxy-D-xylulose-5-phosphate reductoisomerase [Chlorobiota bacterium]
MRKRVAILGSTGSIGKQTLEVIEKHPDDFEVEVLTALNSVDELINQAVKFKPDSVVIGNEDKYEEVKTALAREPVKVYAGSSAIDQVVQGSNIDVVLTAMVGFSGLTPTVNAIKAGKTIALANKETMVVAGEIVTELALKNKVSILPVDSEHSAIFQCLAGEIGNSVEKIYLTASGGPFRGKSLEHMMNVSREDALNHPNWSMGNKITIDSASMMNKGLEAIEAKWLFGLKPEQIDIIVHPQSIIHSIVQFEDGSMKAQMGLPDMRLPIQYALTFPGRLKSDFERFNFLDYPQLTFEKLNEDIFKSVALAYRAMEEGGSMPCVLNAANEIAVDAFLNDKIGFLQMFDIIERTMEGVEYVSHPTLDDYLVLDKTAREFALKYIKGL